MNAILETHAGSIPCRRGKVRDIYDLGDRLVLVATDRISAFDWVLPTGIPDKGRLLTGMSLFWFRLLGESHHIISTELADMAPEFANDPATFEGRSLLVEKTDVIPIECVARGYLAGSAWKEYQETGRACGIELPESLAECQELADPIFTPATKAPHGSHDENIPFHQVVEMVGHDTAHILRDRTLSIYINARDFARGRGIIIADTKFEFGWSRKGELLLIDEVLTPDSSRFWPADKYQPGRGQASFDKQFVRDWLESVGFDKKSPPPPMPPDIVEKTRSRYVEAYERLTGEHFH